MKKLFSLILALMLCAVSGLAVAEGVIGGADGPTGIVVSEPLFILPGDLETAALEAGRMGTTTLTVTEVSGINTGDADMDAALVDLFKALGIKSTVQGDETEFAVSISGTDVLTLGLAVSEDDIYVKSNLLGGTVAVGADELDSLITRLIDMLVMMEAFTEEEAAELKGMVDGVGQAIAALLENGGMDMELTEEDLLALDFSAIMTAMEPIMAKAQMVENPVVPRNCDPAVAGMTLNATNEDMVQVVKAMIQFIKDNPKLMNYIGLQLGLNTEEQLEALWPTFESLGLYESKEEYLADNPTFAQILDEALAELEGKKLLDGDYAINVCVDEAGTIVYMTATLPMFFEQELIYEDKTAEGADAAPVAAEPVGDTVVIEFVYARQTVAQGVSHVVNITVDGETVTVDTLVSGSTAHIVLSVPEEEPVIIDAAVEGNTLTATMTCTPTESTTITCTFDGTYLCTDTEYLLAGKLTVVDVFIPEETEAPSLNGMTLPGYEANKPAEHTNTLTIDFKADYDRSGVDFNGVTDLVFSYNDVRVALQAKSFTSDPTESIMAGAVVRPAELDEEDFANWFVGVVNTISSWTGSLMQALPESLLTMLMYSGM